jgi:hypothetical protein
MKRVISYGGGVDSTAMTLLLLKMGDNPDMIIFADTGGEYPETYNYIDKFDAYLREKAQIGITKIQAKEGPMYEYMLERGWTPSRQYPSHIDRWKLRPILKYIQEWRNGETVEMCIGIDYDESDRMRTPRRRWIVNRYPLVDARVGRRGAERIIKEAGLPLPIKSGCFFCPFQHRSRWLWAKREHPELFAAARKLEENGNWFPKKTLGSWGPLSKIDDLVDGQETLDTVCSVAGMCGV